MSQTERNYEPVRTKILFQLWKEHILVTDPNVFLHSPSNKEPSFAIAPSEIFRNDQIISLCIGSIVRLRSVARKTRELVTGQTSNRPGWALVVGLIDDTHAVAEKRASD